MYCNVFVYFSKITVLYVFESSGLRTARSAVSLFGPTELFCPYGGSSPSRGVLSSGPETLSNTLIFINIALISRNWVFGSGRWFCLFALVPVSFSRAHLTAFLSVCLRPLGDKKGDEELRRRRSKCGSERRDETAMKGFCKRTEQKRRPWRHSHRN